MALVLERHHEITRLQAFCGAVFPFALALLVVSLEVQTFYGMSSGKRRREFVKKPHVASAV
jgi:hypothetical protein